MFPGIFGHSQNRSGPSYLNPSFNRKSSQRIMDTDSVKGATPQSSTGNQSLGNFTRVGAKQYTPEEGIEMQIKY